MRLVSYVKTASNVTVYMDGETIMTVYPPDPALMTAIDSADQDTLLIKRLLGHLDGWVHPDVYLIEDVGLIEQAQLTAGRSQIHVCGEQVSISMVTLLTLLIDKKLPIDGWILAAMDMADGVTPEHPAIIAPTLTHCGKWVSLENDFDWPKDEPTPCLVNVEKGAVWTEYNPDAEPIPVPGYEKVWWDDDDDDEPEAIIFKWERPIHYNIRKVGDTRP